MAQNNQNNSFSVDEFRLLYNRAQEHALYHKQEQGESRNLEAFLMLTLLFEGILTKFGLELLKKRDNLQELYTRRQEWYTIDSAINDMYLLGGVNSKEFKQLRQFQKDRNECVHNILNKRSSEETEQYTRDLFETHKIVFESLLGKMERIKVS